MNKKKEVKIKGYMTFRGKDKKPLNTFSGDQYNFYFEKAPKWQDDDRSIPVILTSKT